MSTTQWMKGLPSAFARAPISVRLVALLLMPVIGLTFFAVSTALNDLSRANAADGLVEQADRVALLSTLSSAIDDEIDSLLSAEDVERVGLEADVGAGAIGGNLSQEALVERVDAAFAAVQALDERSGLDRDGWADPDSVRRALDGYGLIREARVNTFLDRNGIRQLDQLVAAPIRGALQSEIELFEIRQSELELGPDLAATVRASEASVELLDAARVERRALAEYLLDRGDSVEARDRLVEASVRFDVAAAELDRRVPVDLRPSLDDVVSSPSWRAMEDIRRQAVDGGLGDLGVQSDDTRTLGIAVYVQGFQRTADLVVVDRAITDHVATEANELAERSTRDFQLVIGVNLMLAIITAIAGTMTVRSIVLPLRRLQTRAQRITDGELVNESTDGHGPRDLALVDLALDNLTEGLATVNAQTQALSEGRLDDSVLDGTVAGPLGQSIHGSVRRIRTLTSSLEHQANHDRLTGLPNRSALMGLLDECLTGDSASRIPIVAIMIDLDGFKRANDTMGHPAGDEILVQMANRLREVEPEAFLCRLGGDEFMLIMVGEDDEQVGAQLAAQVVEMLSAPIAIAAGTAWLSASAGVVASATPAWLSPTEVMRRTDLALYEAKDLGPGEMVVFDQRLHDSVLMQNQIEGELRKALTCDEFTLHLQPIMETTNNSLVGFEGLLRWEPAGRPAVSPGVFIPAAERSDLILQIDEWVIDRGCQTLAQWRSDPRLAHCSLSLNISGRHVASRDLVRRVRSAISRHEIDPGKLIIEVTESNLIPNIDRADDVFRGLRALGVKLAIDDFGTGYASVAHLRRVEFDRIKIDRTFVSRLDDVTERSIATLLVSLGRDLELEVVAEGIETRDQLAWAAGAGCTHGQGFLFARPAAPDKIDELLQAIDAALQPA